METIFSYREGVKLVDRYDNFVGQEFIFSTGGSRQRLVMVRMDPVDELNNRFRIVCLGQNNGIRSLEDFIELNQLPALDPSRLNHH